MAIYLKEDEVASVLDMPLALDAVEQVMAAHGRGETVDYPRQRVRLPSTMTHLLQGGVPGLNLTGLKVYTSAGPKVRFWVHLFDATTGDPVAVLEADRLGMMRTGAAGGVAAKWLARPDARVAGVFGSGWQAQGQVLALCAARPIERVKVFGRNPDRLVTFCAQMSRETGREIVPAASAEETVRGSDVVVTITTSPKPLFDAEWLGEGTHITAAGSNSLARQELSEAVVRRAAVICVDSREVAVRESGDLMPLLEKGRTQPGRWVELGEVIAGIRPGRTSAQQITLFESQGMAIQDIALAARVLERAREGGLGQALPY
ncbi:ornithine cyclodeaminase family protein [Azoarcus sp. KH32C]|uniref:ornithine cyclodeaminase family protein n=1 Tax=Azoarcus sp. KH32C TaxID=748247 RepID=UPI0002386BA9|nr:ornithine cyclodeaminase family protein [Azoarcus sp. KH32C]BAL25965.1 ornithine cyclodeaminase [Azoarcus sp. KH32C]